MLRNARTSASRYVALCFVFLVLLGPMCGKALAAEQAAAVARVETAAQALLSGHTPLDFERFVSDLRMLSAEANEADRDRLASLLEQVVAYEGDIRYQTVPRTALTPREIIDIQILRLFERWGLPAPDLRRADPGRFQPLAEPTPAEQQAAQQAREQAAQIARDCIHDPGAAGARLADAVDALGRCGTTNDVPLLVELYGRDPSHWIVRQTVLRAIGELGGSDAREFLCGEIVLPLPVGIDPADRSDVTVLLRSEIALALGQCGDAACTNMLLSLSQGTAQPVRTREACLKAVHRIAKRQNADR